MKTVGVVGLGPAGLSTVKELKAAGMEVKGFDRHSSVGGRWSLEGDLGIYEELHLNVSRRYVAFSDFPWEKDTIADRAEGYVGVYPHCSEAKSYFEEYCKHFDLFPHIQLSTEITSIDEKDGIWTITTKHVSSGKEATHTFDALVICTGHQSKPMHPLKDTTLKDYTGTLLHSAQLKSMKAFKDQRVLVIGSAISGADTCSSLATYGNCAKIVNCVRKVPYHFSLLSDLTGNTAEEELFCRAPAWLDAYLPPAMGRQGLKGELLKHWPDQIPPELADGLELNNDPGYAGVALSRMYMTHFKEGNISVKAGLASATGKTVTFKDGSKEDFDAIICCTGYEADLSFLPKSVYDKVAYQKPFSKEIGTQLYKHTLGEYTTSNSCGGFGELKLFVD
jgi:hypothetical protein